MGRWRCALLVGRFHAITRVQAAWIAALRDAPVERIVCVVTGADRSGTRRNPLAAADREGLVRPLLARTGKPFDVVRCRDVPDDADWVRHLLAEVDAATGSRLEPSCATLYASNHEVDALFAAAGFPVVTANFAGPSPMELLRRIAHGAPWHEDASDETRALYAAAGRAAWLRGVFDEPLVNDDGELGHQRDFDTYGAQMDASLRQKLTELLPWVKPGCVVDKGCGTGRLLVELSRVFPTSAFVGVDLSRELLRRSDEQTYASEDVELVRGNITERNVAAGRATTVIFSSVMHEVYSYGGYRREAIHRALESARDELVPGGRLLVRDGVSPGDELCRRGRAPARALVVSDGLEPR